MESSSKSLLIKTNQNSKSELISGPVRMHLFQRILSNRLPMAVLDSMSYTATRSLVVSAVSLQGKNASDPIQQLFLDKIREYRTKQAKAAGGLVDADEETRKSMAADQERIRNTFGLKSDADLGNITVDASETIELDDINMRK